ncbi:MAG: urea ABC transporter ATP-binding subunit UrtE [Deltaproteobacteria bacterium]|nr:urea ABC transporter ATP-binding subunit UrtE [Deltaproteobacteria bacterium]
MLSVEGVNQFYGESHTLWDAQLNLPAGACTCLMGRNGVGKTTLLKCVMGLLPIKTGSIRMGDSEISRKPAEVRAGVGIGYVPQGREIFGQLSIEENLMVGFSALKKKKAGALERVYNTFPVLKQMRSRRGGDLSGGQQQQLAIGRALMLDPKLLILDEPTEGIQPNIVSEIGDILAGLNQKEGLTILFVEQKLPFARKFAQHFAIMERGHTVASGAMTDLTQELVDKHLTV